MQPVSVIGPSAAAIWLVSQVYVSGSYRVRLASFEATSRARGGGVQPCSGVVAQLVGDAFLGRGCHHSADPGLGGEQVLEQVGYLCGASVR